METLIVSCSGWTVHSLKWGSGELLCSSGTYTWCRLVTRKKGYRCLPYVTWVRKVQFRKEKLHSVAQSDLFQMVCLTHNLFSNTTLAFSQCDVLCSYCSHAELQQLNAELQHIENLYLYSTAQSQLFKQLCEQVSIVISQWYIKTGIFNGQWSIIYAYHKNFKKSFLENTVPYHHTLTISPLCVDCRWCVKLTG